MFDAMSLPAQIGYMARGGWALGLLLGLLAGCTRQAGPPPSAADVPDGPVPDYESWDVTLNLSEQGRPRARLQAPYLARFAVQDSSYTLMEIGPDSTTRVTVYLYDEAGDASATVHADQLFYFDEEGRFEARGDVQVETVTGKRLFSEHLRWDEAARKVRTPGFVRILTAEERIQGYNLMADEDLSTYTLARVTGQVTVRE